MNDQGEAYNSKCNTTINARKKGENRGLTLTIPEDCKWEYLVNTYENIGQKFFDIVTKIGLQNPSLQNIFVINRFDCTNKNFRSILIDILRLFDSLDLRESRLQKDKVLGEAFNELVDELSYRDRQFWNTPRQLVSVLVNLINPQEGMEIHDPVCGSGFLLSSVQNMLHAMVIIRCA